MSKCCQTENQIESLRRVRDEKALRRWLKDQGLDLEVRGKHASVDVKGRRIIVACTPGGGNRGVMNARANILRAIRQ